MTEADDTHTTLGRRFRTPAHPDVLAAFGRALYTFLSLEESVTAVLYDAGHMDLSESRSLMAGGKSMELRVLADRYRGSGGDRQVAEKIDAALVAFDGARKEIRNQLLHAHPFTSKPDASGAYVPGLAYTAEDGESWKTLARSPNDLLDLAAAVEEAVDPLSDARAAVKATPPRTGT